MVSALGVITFFFSRLDDATFFHAVSFDVSCRQLATAIPVMITAAAAAAAAQAVGVIVIVTITTTMTTENGLIAAVLLRLRSTASAASGLCNTTHPMSRLDTPAIGKVPLTNEQGWTAELHTSYLNIIRVPEQLLASLIYSNSPSDTCKPQCIPCPGWRTPDTSR